MKITVRNIQRKTRLNPNRIKKLVLKVLSSEGFKKPGEITICFVTDQDIKALNSRYLGVNKPTDVIAFDLSGPGERLFADIIVSVDRAVHNARVFKTRLVYELYLYIVHGILHILGYTDKKAKEREAMQSKAKQILTEFNFS